MANSEGPLYCRRCDALVGSIRPWRGWKPAWTAWKIGLVVVLALFPLLASDYCIMLPSMMVYLAAGGPLREYAKTRPVCRRCSLELTEGEPALPRA
jgi:hypothetical protein